MGENVCGNDSILNDRAWRRQLIGMVAKELLADVSRSGRYSAISTQKDLEDLCLSATTIADAIIAAEKGNGEKG